MVTGCATLFIGNTGLLALQEVAALFEKRNLLGEAGVNDQSSEKYSK